MLSAIIDKKFRKRIFHILNLFAFVRGIKLTYEHTKLFLSGISTRKRWKRHTIYRWRSTTIWRIMIESCGLMLGVSVEFVFEFLTLYWYMVVYFTSNIYNHACISHLVSSPSFWFTNCWEYRQVFDKILIAYIIWIEDKIYHLLNIRAGEPVMVQVEFKVISFGEIKEVNMVSCCWL